MKSARKEVLVRLEAEAREMRRLGRECRRVLLACALSGCLLFFLRTAATVRESLPELPAIRLDSGAHSGDFMAREYAIPGLFPWAASLLLTSLCSAAWLATRTLRDSRRESVRVLMEMDVPEAVGPLAEAWHFGDAETRHAVEASLFRLFPRLNEGHFHRLSAEQREWLCRSLRSRNTQYVLRLLKTLEQFGDASAVCEVERLAGRAGDTLEDARVSQAAEACLPLLQGRAETERRRQSLLRPYVEAEDAAFLLRPAARASMNGPESTLLRPLSLSYNLSSLSADAGKVEVQ